MAIKPLTLEATTTAVYVGDPAIDQEALVSDGNGGEILAVMKYAEDAAMGDPSSWRDTLKMIDGQAPTEFVIGAIPPAELCAIEDECGLGKADAQTRKLRWLCFCASLRDIKNGPTVKEKVGASYRSVVPKVTKGGVERVDPDWLAETFARGYKQCALFIGGLAWSWNNLSEDDSKN